MEKKPERKQTDERRTKPKKKKSRMRRVLWVLFFTAAAGVFCAMAAYLFIIVSGDKYLDENINKLTLKEASIIYDSGGNEATKLYSFENRESVKLEQVPELVRKAFIATEDRRFEEHEGIDYVGIGRALVKDIIARKAVEGASTITQQLARNLFLNNDKTFFRKATEMSIATALEGRFTKDQILEMYLNRIYFGKGAYGIQAAAETYFGKDNLADLTIDEIAVLAGIPKAPSYYNPIDNPENAKKRRDTVLFLMAEQNVITQEEKEAAQAKEISVQAYQTNIDHPSYMDYVMKEAQEEAGLTEEQLYNGGYQIYTTLDVKAQSALEEAYDNPENFPKDGPEQKVQSSMVIMDNTDGGIAALIGGRDYARKGLNRAVAKRQPGSSFKPIAAYAPALETEEWNPYSMLSNEKQSFNGYSPKNLGGKYGGKVTMLEAVRKSINIPAVWLLNEIGVKTGLNFASSLGIEMSKEDRNLSIALGGLTNGASPLEMARAYSAFANNGILNKPHSITRILDKQGKEVYLLNPKKNQERVMSEKTAWYMTLLLKDVVIQGTGTKAKVKNHEVAGKTGTTQSGIKGVGGNRDIWFVGYTNRYTASVWMGFDKTDKKHVLADYSGTAASLFSKVMTKALKGSKASKLVKPEGVPELKQTVDAVSDLSALYAQDLNQVQVNWTALNGEYEYRLFRKSIDEDAFTLITATPHASVLDITILPGQTYQYYVVVYDPKRESESEPSATVEVAIPEEQPMDDIPEDELNPADPGAVPGDQDQDGIPDTEDEQVPGDPNENPDEPSPENGLPGNGGGGEVVPPPQAPDNPASPTNPENPENPSGVGNIITEILQ